MGISVALWDWTRRFKFHATTPKSGPLPDDVHSTSGFARLTMADKAYWGFATEEERDAFVQTYNAELVL